MNRIFNSIFGRLGFVIAAIVLDHIAARVLWVVFSSFFSNVNIQQNVWGYPDDTINRTLWNYTPDFWSFIGTHLLGAAMLFVLGCIVALVYLIVSWIIQGTETPEVAEQTQENIASDESAEDEVVCKDPRCRCTYHYDEVFDRDKMEWRLATDKEMGERYQQTLTSVN